MLTMTEVQGIAALVSTARDANDQGYHDLADDIISLVQERLEGLSLDSPDDEGPVPF